MATLKKLRPNALLPTPTTLDGKDRTYYSKGDLALGGAVQQLTFSPEASPASLFPQQDEGAARRTTAISGLKCYESYAKSVLPMSWARTLAASLLGTEAWYSSRCVLTWKLKATKSARSLFQLAPSTRRTAETECGLLLTPSVVMPSEHPDSFMARKVKNGYKNGTKWGSLASQVEHGFLATPNTLDSMAPKTEKAVLREATVTRPGRTKMSNLRDQLWHGILLHTPSAQEPGVKVERLQTKDGEPAKVGQRAYDKETGRLAQVGLSQQVGMLGMRTGLRLQPGFALWMMGYPTDWLDLEAGEMPPSKARATR